MRLTLLIWGQEMALLIVQAIGIVIVLPGSGFGIGAKLLDYRLFVFDDHGKLIAPAMIIHAANDDDAILEAAAKRGVRVAELRDGFGLVKMFLHGAT
jgi:hypothetical protein